MRHATWAQPATAQPPCDRACGRACPTGESCVGGSCQASQCGTGGPTPAAGQQCTLRRTCVQPCSADLFLESASEIVLAVRAARCRPKSLLPGSPTCCRSHLLPLRLYLPSGYLCQLQDGQQQLVRGQHGLQCIGGCMEKLTCGKCRCFAAIEVFCPALPCHAGSGACGQTCKQGDETCVNGGCDCVPSESKWLLSWSCAAQVFNSGQVAPQAATKCNETPTFQTCFAIPL